MNKIPLCIALILGTVPVALTAQELAPDSDTPQAAVMQPAKPDPAASAAKVTKALAGTKGLTPGDISVSTHAATVVLTGKVNSEEQRVTANAVAEKAAEGARVLNNIEVRPVEDRPVQDQKAALQSVQVVGDVEAALKADTRTASLGITVTSTDGHAVILQGLVPTAENRSAVQMVASKVNGVTRVDNRVQVPGK